MKTQQQQATGNRQQTKQAAESDKAEVRL